MSKGEILVIGFILAMMLVGIFVTIPKDDSNRITRHVVEYEHELIPIEEYKELMKSERKRNIRDEKVRDFGF